MSQVGDQSLILWILSKALDLTFILLDDFKVIWGFKLEPVQVVKHLYVESHDKVTKKNNEKTD